MNVITRLAIGILLAVSGPVLADKTAGQIVDDSVIQAEAKAMIMGDNLVAGGWDINLETRKGVVQMGGFIDDAATGEKAEAQIATIEGVLKVDNQLQVKSGKRSAGQVIDDGITTTRVKTAIGSADLGEGIKVNVDTYNGTVLLTGFVDTAEDKKAAGDIAAKDENAKTVVNGIYVLE